MAAPITHIVFSEKLFPEYIEPQHRSVFLVGTSFPDIRYKGVISREDSHPKVANFSEVLAETNPFYAGQKFHSYFDSKREDYLKDRGLYDLVPNDSRFITHAVKFLEDKIYYHKVSDWNGVASAFDKVRPEELRLGISTVDIEAWHKTLQEYFLVPPSEGSLSRFLSGIILPQEAENEINSLVTDLEGNDDVIKLLEGMYDNLDIEGKLNEGDVTEY